jgi:long-chain acyl-CoA synthetase
VRVAESDGWFRTGDIGEITQDGSLKIIDRVKNIFKLAQGEYVAVENVENELKKFDQLEQLWVYGNSFESCVVAVVVPVEAKLMAWAKQNNVKGDFHTVCASEQAKKMLLEGLTTTGREARLKGFEIVKNVHVEPAPFDVEKGLLTPTFKLKRPQLQKYYQKEIDAMYAALKK